MAIPFGKITILVGAGSYTVNLVFYIFWLLNVLHTVIDCLLDRGSGEGSLMNNNCSFSSVGRLILGLFVCFVCGDWFLFFFCAEILALRLCVSLRIFQNYLLILSVKLWWSCACLIFKFRIYFLTLIWVEAMSVWLLDFMAKAIPCCSRVCIPWIANLFDWFEFQGSTSLSFRCWKHCKWRPSWISVLLALNHVLCHLVVLFENA